MSGENVRLVVWDLDETFWRGTLTEGGIEYLEENANIVIELAKRGIMSSICSRNDLQQVKTILEEKQIWDYFIFPSINWDAKGLRLKSLVEAVQLRPETIIFIDDNPMNLNEAKHFIPEIQVSNESIIPNILSLSIFQGKDDSSLSRLAQYKVLESKKIDEIAAGGDTKEFLRSSGIKVVIDANVEGNLDRAVELINRTNQLNFTKIRLSENIEVAKDELRLLLSDYSICAGLIRVYDKYGDYGYCGLYIERRVVHHGSGLLHYCFSCRTLGMGVEKWLYNQLGRPHITIVGEVLSDIIGMEDPVDWISLDDGKSKQEIKSADCLMPIVQDVRIGFRGACDLLVLSHYFKLVSKNIGGEFAITRSGVQTRLEHSLFMKYAAEGVTLEEVSEFSKLGFEKNDFYSYLFEYPQEKKIWILSFWSDAEYPIYRHNKLGKCIPFNAFPITGIEDLTKVDISAIRKLGQEDWVIAALEVLRKDYEFIGLLPEDLFKKNLRAAFCRLKDTDRVFIIGAPESRINASGHVEYSGPGYKNINKWCRDLIDDFPMIKILDINDYISSSQDFQGGWTHFNRNVYYRIYSSIRKFLEA